MTIRTVNEAFAPALRSASALEWTHGRIRLFATKDQQRRFINSLFGAGRIDGTARVMLLDLYVEEDECGYCPRPHSSQMLTVGAAHERFTARQ
jgi:hypothetical protein